MKIDGIIEDLGYHILNSKDENFLSDIMYAASLSDDELDDKFYDCLVFFWAVVFLVNLFLNQIRMARLHISVF